ncbi:hypothetical protein QL285_081810 [Trifolium repens]|nr:hypothetical protein QL285_081810 [Trifolium repens]
MITYTPTRTSVAKFVMEVGINVAFKPTLYRLLPLDFMLLLLHAHVPSSLLVIDKVSFLPHVLCFKTKTSSRFRDVVPNLVIPIIPQDPGHRSKQTGLLSIFSSTNIMNNRPSIHTMLKMARNNNIQSSGLPSLLTTAWQVHQSVVE